MLRIIWRRAARLIEAATAMDALRLSETAFPDLILLDGAAAPRGVCVTS